METTATAQLSTHQSAGDVIASINGAGLMCWGRSMAQRSAPRTIHRHHPHLRPPSELLARSLSSRADDFELMSFVQSVKLWCHSFEDKHFSLRQGRSWGDRWSFAGYFMKMVNISETTLFFCMTNQRATLQCQTNNRDKKKKVEPQMMRNACEKWKNARENPSHWVVNEHLVEFMSWHTVVHVFFYFSYFFFF